MVKRCHTCPAADYGNEQILLATKCKLTLARLTVMKEQERNGFNISPLCNKAQMTDFGE